jgi:hypothetical protein
MKPVFPIVFLILPGILSADPVLSGSLEWSGTATYTECASCLSSSPYITLTDLGVNTDSLGMSPSSDLLTDYTVDTPFTVKSAGDFKLSSYADYFDEATTCTPVHCPASSDPPLPNLAANFSAMVDILDSSNNLVYGQSLSATGVSVYTTGGGCFHGNCFANISLADYSDPTSELVDLAAGNYTLMLSYYGYNDSIGSNSGGGGVNADLIPVAVATPEPREDVLLVIALAILLLVKGYVSTLGV